MFFIVLLPTAVFLWEAEWGVSIRLGCARERRA
jgi:hypothetical protein